MKNEQDQKNNQNHFTYLLLSLSLLLTSRLLPLFKAPLSTFGYDYGFYFFAAKTAILPFAYSLSATLWGGFNNPLFYFFNLLHVPPAFSLTLSYLIFSLLLGLSLYLFFGKTNKRAGLFAIALYALSMVQMESYLMFLYKNAFALPFMILGFKSIMQNADQYFFGQNFWLKKYWLALLFCTLTILLIHRTTAIIYLLTIGMYFLWLMIKNKKWKLLITLSTLGFLAFGSWFFFFNLKSIIYNLISHNNFYVRTGLFLPFDNPLKIVWPYLLLAIPGIIMYIKRKKNALPVIFTAVSLLWLIFQLPFHRRVWIYFDLSLIIFAAYFLSFAVQKTKLPKSAVIAAPRTFYGIGVIVLVIVIFLGYRFTDFTLAKQPLILPSQVQEIKTFNYPPGMILAISANDAPWLLAYTNNFRLGAPGLLEDPHTYEEWLDFWQGKNQREFISKYPRPLYFYQRAYRLNFGEVVNCLRPVSANFSKVDYSCLEKTLP